MENNANVEEMVRQALEARGLVYEIMACDPDMADTAAFCAHYGIPVDQSANTIVVAARKEPRHYCACLVLADSRLDVNHTVSRLMDVRRLSFASEQETVALTGMMVGGVTLLALPQTWPIYIDSRVMEKEWVIIGGGSRSTKIKLNPVELLKVPNVLVIEGLARLRSD